MQMSKHKRVLNLFAYTGSVSVFAALGGAKQVTTVDMSNTYLDWAKRNFQLNKIQGRHPFIKADDELAKDYRRRRRIESRAKNTT